MEQKIEFSIAKSGFGLAKRNAASKRMNITTFRRLELMYAKFKIEVLNISRFNWAFKMTFSLVIFYLSAMDGCPKREVLEIFNMN